MNTSNLLKDPYYAQIIFQIEHRIHHRDTQTSGVLRDSDVKSAIRKALTLLKGKPLKAKPKNDREIMVVNLARELVECSGELRSANPENEDDQIEVPKADFANSLLAVERSLKTRREMNLSSRGYLDFIGDFLAEATAA